MGQVLAVLFAGQVAIDLMVDQVAVSANGKGGDRRAAGKAFLDGAAEVFAQGRNDGHVRGPIGGDDVFLLPEHAQAAHGERAQPVGDEAGRPENHQVRIFQMVRSDAFQRIGQFFESLVPVLDRIHRAEQDMTLFRVQSQPDAGLFPASRAETFRVEAVRDDADVALAEERTLPGAVRQPAARRHDVQVQAPIVSMFLPPDLMAQVLPVIGPQ